jgi:hypothetical protein
MMPPEALPRYYERDPAFVSAPRRIPSPNSEVCASEYQISSLQKKIQTFSAAAPFVLFATPLWGRISFRF